MQKLATPHMHSGGVHAAAAAAATYCAAKASRRRLVNHQRRVLISYHFGHTTTPFPSRLLMRPTQGGLYIRAVFARRLRFVDSTPHFAQLYATAHKARLVCSKVNRALKKSGRRRRVRRVKCSTRVCGQSLRGAFIGDTHTRTLCGRNGGTRGVDYGSLSGILLVARPAAAILITCANDTVHARVGTRHTAFYDYGSVRALLCGCWSTNLHESRGTDSPLK
jgi:hypothetical protein